MSKVSERWIGLALLVVAFFAVAALAMALVPATFGPKEDFVLYVRLGLSRRQAAEVSVFLLVAIACYLLRQAIVTALVKTGTAAAVAMKRLRVWKNSTIEPYTGPGVISFALVLASVLVTFTAIELMSYVIYPNPVRTTRTKPYVAFGGEPNAVFDINTVHNALGYNGKMPAVREHEYSIFVLGGSTVWYGNPSISSALEEIARQNGYANVSVYNFGVPGANSAEELARLVHEVVDYKPSLVIFYDGGNDIVHPAHYMDPRPCAPFNQIVTEWNPFDSMSPHSPSRLVMLLSTSRFLRHAAVIPYLDYFFDLDGLRREVGWGSPKWRQQIADCYLTNHEKARVIANGFGAEFHSFFQPLLAYTEPKDSRSWESEHSNALRVLILEGAHRRNIRLHDLTMVFDKGTPASKDIFMDWVHVRQDVHRTIAQRIFDEIKGSLSAAARS